MERGVLLSVFLFIMLITSISASSFGYDTEDTDAIDSFGYDSRRAIVSEVSNITIINTNITNINQTITSQIVVNNSQESFINSSFPQNFNFTGNLSLGEIITFAFGETIDNIINGWIRITGNLNVTGEVSTESLIVRSNNISNGTAVFNFQDLNKSEDRWDVNSSNNYLYNDSDTFTFNDSRLLDFFFNQTQILTQYFNSSDIQTQYFNKTDIQQAYFNITDYNATDRGFLIFNRTKSGNNVTLHASV